MRNLEKGILLAELIDPNLPSQEQKDNLIAWIREQECYTSLLTNMNEIKKSSTFLAQALYDEFKSLDLDRVTSVEEGLISYAKILYLSQISTPNFYVNPLLVLNKKERNILLGQVIVKFNDAYATLDEVVSTSEASFDEKYAFIKNQVARYEQDVYDRIKKPIAYFKNGNPRNLPKVRSFGLSHFFFILCYLLMGGFVIYGFVTSSPFDSIFKNYEVSSFFAGNYLFWFFFCFFNLGLIVLIGELIASFVKYHKYSKCHKVIIDKDQALLPYIQKQGQKLSNSLIYALEKKTPLKEEIFKYSRSLDLYEYVLYLYHVNYKCKKIKKSRISTFSWYLLLLNVIFLGLSLLSVVI